MFGHRYFGARFFGTRYWGQGGALVPPVAEVSPEYRGHRRDDADVDTVLKAYELVELRKKNREQPPAPIVEIEAPVVVEPTPPASTEPAPPVHEPHPHPLPMLQRYREPLVLTPFVATPTKRVAKKNAPKPAFTDEEIVDIALLVDELLN